MDTTEEEFCRLCGDLKQNSDLIDLLIDTEKLLSINTMLERFNITLDLEKNLPTSVCSTCTSSLKQAYDFVSFLDLAQKAFEDCVSSSDGENDDDSVYLDVRSAEDIEETKTLEDSEISEEMTVGEDDDMSGVNGDCEKDDEEISDIDAAYKEDTGSINDEESTESDDGSNTRSKRLNASKPTKKSNVKKKRTEAESIGDIEETETVELRRGRKKSLRTLISSELTPTWKTYKWICAYCDGYYYSLSELRVHSMQYHNICNPFRCLDCRARGSHIDKFIMHVVKHHPNLTLICHICSSDFSTTLELRQHKQKVHKLHRFTHICGMTFQTKEELENHKNNFYKNVTIRMTPFKDDEILICVICKKILKTKVLLNRHLLIHTDRKRNHPCKLCKKRFYTKRELTQHVVVHSERRPHKCEICDFPFKMKSDLRKHVLKHFEMKRFTCDRCGKRFQLKKELIVHSKIHKDTRPFICDYCNKAFRYKHLLSQHIRIHTGVKPYKCKICSKKFTNWPNYNRHSKGVHGKNCARKKTSEGKDREKVITWGFNILEPQKKGRPKKSDKSKKNNAKEKE
uniref:SFRICE_005616 n=1 Tax=Spodoptera frugiperda TaxID=7108 RepID=A0A2H1VF55_SPOFR